MHISGGHFAPIMHDAAEGRRSLERRISLYVDTNLFKIGFPRAEGAFS